MAVITPELRELIEGGPMAHLTTINADGSPQVSVIWIALDGAELVSGHMRHNQKLKNIERDPRVALSFDAPRDHNAFLNPYAVLHATARVERSDHAWDLLNRLAKVYMQPDSEFPGARRPGFIARYRVDRITGVGPWAPH
jgi:PPOX class probable F420-dependent enzyme